MKFSHSFVKRVSDWNVIRGTAWVAVERRSPTEAIALFPGPRLSPNESQGAQFARKRGRGGAGTELPANGHSPQEWKSSQDYVQLVAVLVILFPSPLLKFFRFPRKLSRVPFPADRFLARPAETNGLVSGPGEERAFPAADPVSGEVSGSANGGLLCLHSSPRREGPGGTETPTQELRHFRRE